MAIVGGGIREVIASADLLSRVSTKLSPFFWIFFTNTFEIVASP